MEFNHLVELVYEEIVKKLNQQQTNGKTICILSKEPCEHLPQTLKDTYQIQYFSEQLEVASFEKIIIPELTVSMLAHIANGLASTSEEKFIIDALLLGKKIIVFHEGVEHYKYKQSAPKLFYKVYEDYERKLKGFGIEFICRDEFHEDYNKDSSLEQPEELTPPPSTDVYKLSKHVITESDIKKLYMQKIRKIEIEKNSIVTPLAKDYLQTYQIQLLESRK